MTRFDSIAKRVLVKFDWLDSGKQQGFDSIAKRVLVKWDRKQCDQMFRFDSIAKRVLVKSANWPGCS